MAGFDTGLIREPNIAATVDCALAQGRIILSRNRRYAEWKSAERFFLLRVDVPALQLRAVLTEFGLRLDEERFLSRCLECNTELVGVDKEQIRGRVFPYVYQTQTRFFLCYTCNKVYWHATHAAAMISHLRSLATDLHNRD